MHSRTRSNWGYVKVDCDVCTHTWIHDVLIQPDGELESVQSEHCPECGANFDMDLFAAGVVAFRS